MNQDNKKIDRFLLKVLKKSKSKKYRQKVTDFIFIDGEEEYITIPRADYESLYFKRNHEKKE